MPNHKIYIDGAAGTTGLQIHQRLSELADVDLIMLPDELRKDLAHRVAAISQADLSILCLPDDAAREIVAAAPAGARICDASTAHRTLPDWVYGFAELGGRRQLIAEAKRVAVPGCYASGFLALAAPLVETGVLSPTVQLSCHALSGYSGAGKNVIADYESDERPAAYDAPRLYALGLQHKHLPEMKAISGLKKPPLFSPIICDYYSGMLVNIHLPADKLAREWRSPGRLAALYQDYYANEPLFTVKALPGAPADGMIPANGMSGRDDMELFVLGNEDQLLLSAWFDNLGKGAAGAAVQCANLMLGRPETDGLRLGAEG